MIAAAGPAGAVRRHRGPAGLAPVSVRSAVLHTVEEVAVNTWRVDKQQLGDLPDLAFLVKELERLEAGDQGMLAAVRRREARARGEAGSRRSRTSSSCRTPARARPWSRCGPATGPACCTRSARALARRGLSIRSAHISTLAGQAIDTFYVTEADGSPPERWSGAARPVSALTRRRPKPTRALTRRDQVVHLGRGGRLGAAPGADDRRGRRPPAQRVLEIQPELDPRVEEAGHEGVAGADRVDHLGREARRPGSPCPRFHGRAASGAERDHRQPEAVLVDPAGRDLDRIAAPGPPGCRSASARNSMSSSLALTMPVRAARPPAATAGPCSSTLRVGDHRRAGR